MPPQTPDELICNEWNVLSTDGKLFRTPFCRDRLPDFLDLNFVLAQVINSSSLFMSLDVHRAVWADM